MGEKDVGEIEWYKYLGLLHDLRRMWNMCGWTKWRDAS